MTNKIKRTIIYIHISKGRPDMYSYVNMAATGARLRDKIFEAGYNVKSIQDYLELACPQSIYKWIRGESLPSINHLYMLSKLFDVHMEELIVTEDDVLLSLIDKVRKKHHIKNYVMTLNKM